MEKTNLSRTTTKHFLMKKPRLKSFTTVLERLIVCCLCLLLVLGYNIFADDLPESSLIAIVNQDNFNYFDVGAGSYRLFSSRDGTVSIPMRTYSSIGGKQIGYMYIPLYLTDVASINIGMSTTSSGMVTPSAPMPTSVDVVLGGVSTSVDFTQGDSYTLTPSDGTLPVRFNDLTFAYSGGNIDVVRLRMAANSGITGFGLRYIVLTTTGGDIQIIINLIGDLQATINELISVIKSQGDFTSTQLVTITEYLHTIVTISDEDRLQIITIQNSYSSINETMQHYESIIDAANASINAPTASAAAGALDRTQILPDFDASSIGAGSSDSGIGIILSNAWVVKMLVAVLGIASLSYILYGKKG